MTGTIPHVLVCGDCIALGGRPARAEERTQARYVRSTAHECPCRPPRAKGGKRASCVGSGIAHSLGSQGGNGVTSGGTGMIPILFPFYSFSCVLFGWPIFVCLIADP